MNSQESIARLLITCPDRPGIVASVSGFLYNHGANITCLDQHSSDPEGGTLFMRIEFQTPHLDLSGELFSQTFAKTVASKHDMNWKISFSANRKKIALLVSKYDHAMLDLLWRGTRRELLGDISLVVSNHPDLEKAVQGFGIPFEVVPVESKSKDAAESRLLETLEKNNIDLVVLARYMQILSPGFVEKYPMRIINIHHSFLPAFVGANPYRQALEKGVKVIGATAHFVTADLDQGPIIEQDVARVTHRSSIEDMKELGANLERAVLARAVKWYLEDRIIVHQNRTIVFN